MDHLLDLDEELDLADAAAPALEIVARADLRALCEMVADARRNLPYLIDDAEIERAPPDKWLDRVEKALAQREVAGAGAGADEGGAFPGQRGRFIMRDRGMNRQCDRSHLRRRTQPQIDPLDIAVLGPLLQQLDQTPADPHCRFPGLIAGAPRQSLGIEQQQQVDIRRIIELAAAELAHGDDRKALWLGIGNAFSDRCGDGPVDRRIGEAGQQPRHCFERELSGEIAKRDRERESVTLAAKLGSEISTARRQRKLGCRRRTTSQEYIRDRRLRLQRLAQEGRVVLRSVERIASHLTVIFRFHMKGFIARIARAAKLPAPFARLMRNGFRAREGCCAGFDQYRPASDSGGSSARS